MAMGRTVARRSLRVLAGGLLLALVGCEAGGPAPENDDPALLATQVLVRGPTLGPQEAPARRRPLPSGPPRRVSVPRLGVDVPVVPIAAPGGVLTPPDDPRVLGWWSRGAVPGARTGSALVTGHTVSTGGGALDDLERLSAGDVVRVSTNRGRISYSVESTDVLGKGELAQRAEDLFDQSVPGRLVLITCEDWNGQEYLSNVVVTASPVA